MALEERTDSVAEEGREEKEVWAFADMDTHNVQAHFLYYARDSICAAFF